MTLSKQTILDQLYQKIERHDLPILRQSAARVMTLASSHETEVNALAHTILQDQPFTARLLKLANSFYYNRSPKRPVLSVTRAVMLVGYSALRDLSLASEFAEFAQRRMPEGVNLPHIIAKAFIAANQASDLGKALGLPNAEMLFTSALLRSIGELALAYHLPTVHLEIHASMVQDRCSYEEAHSRIVGADSRDAVKGVCEIFHIPNDLISVLPVDWDRCEQWDPWEKHHAVIDLANQIATNLLSAPSATTDKEFNGLIERASKTFKIEPSTLTVTVKSAFHKSVRLADVIKLDPNHLRPTQADSQDPPTLRNELVDACLSFIPPPPPSQPDPEDRPASGHEGSPAAVCAAPQTGEHPPLLSLDYMNFLMELSAHMLDKPNFNTIMNLVLEGLYRAVGFTHTFLLLLDPNDHQFVARLGFGPLTDTLLTTFTIASSPSCETLTSLLTKPFPLRLTQPFTDLETVIPPLIIETLKPVEIAIGPLRAKARTIGLIWADAPKEITDPMWSAFELFILQANVGLNSLSR